jgi:hypothetical protein
MLRIKTYTAKRGFVEDKWNAGDIAPRIDISPRSGSGSVEFVATGEELALILQAVKAASWQGPRHTLPEYRRGL